MISSDSEHPFHYGWLANWLCFP